MSLLPDGLLDRLPTLGEQQDEMDPFVYARLYFPSTSCSFWVIEGEASSERTTLNCFFTTELLFGFACFSLGELERILGPEGQPLVCDPEFTEGWLTDVVPAPDS